MIVIPSTLVSTRLEREIEVWRKRLANPELLDKAVFINEAAYKDIRVPEQRDRKGRLILNVEDAHKWKKEIESYKPLIPVGGQRRAGAETCFDDPVESIALQEMRSRPNHFPDIRVVPSQFGYGHDIWWGEDISEIWNAQTRLLGTEDWVVRSATEKARLCAYILIHAGGGYFGCHWNNHGFPTKLKE